MSVPDPASPGAAPAARGLVWLAPLAAAVVAILTWRVVLGWALLGWDSYPMVVAGRVDGVGGLLATFGEELMEGRYPLGSFWRPVVHLAFALDHALFGLDPWGYHLSDLTVLATSAALVALLAERLLVDPRLVGDPYRSGRWPLAGLVAGLAFALHPLHYEVLPVAPRRADGLAVLFTLLALHLALTALRRADAGRAGARWPAWLGALACALALAAKETGAIAPVAVGLLALLLPAEPGSGAPATASGRARLARALRVAGPAALLFALCFALRTSVLGGLGGGQESSLTSGLARAHVFAATYARALLLPDAVWDLDPGDPAPAFAALAVVGALGALVAVRGDARLRAGALFLAAWVLLLLPLTGMSALAQGWYAFPYLPALALGAGLLAAAGRRALRLGRRLEGGAALVLGLALALAGAPGTPWLDDASDFERASQLERDYLARFEQRLAEAAPGQQLTLPGCPTVIQRVTQRATGEVAYFIGPDQALDAPPDQFESGRLIYALAGYSLEAYADLVLGPGRARVTLPGLPPSPRQPGPEVIDVTVLPPRSPWVR